MIHLGNIPASSTLYIPFATYGSNGESITLTGLAVTDIEIYKNGSTTQRASDNGYTLLDTDGIDFDGITGIHGFSVDLSDNSDAGFFAAGATYWVVISAVTVNAQTVNFVAATFRIVVAEGTAGTPAVDCVRISNDATAADNAESFFDGTGYAGTNNVIPLVTTTTNVTTVNGLAANVITATSIADGAIDAATFAANAITATAIADGAIDAATFATGAITATAIAADAIGASELAADALAEIADAVWDEVQAGHTSAGTFGKYLDTAVSGVSTGGITAGDIADAVWDEARAGHVAAGSFGQGVVVSSLATNSITADTIALDAITSDEMAASAASEIGSGIIVSSAGNDRI